MELHKKVQRVIRIATVGNICTDSRVDIITFRMGNLYRDKEYPARRERMRMTWQKLHFYAENK